MMTDDYERQKLEDAVLKTPDYMQQGWKPCPFCGGEMMFRMVPVRTGILSSGYDLYLVHRDGGCIIPDIPIPREVRLSELRETWNHRIPMTQKPESPGLMEVSL